MPNGSILKALNATIDTVAVNNETLHLQTPIPAYKGEPLYITSLTPTVKSNGNFLTVTITNDGPPAASTVPTLASAKVKFMVSYKGSMPTPTVFTKNDVAFSNKPLVLTGLPTPNPSPSVPESKWDGSTLTLFVEEFRNVASDTGIVYVIRHDSGTPSGQLWWLTNPNDNDLSVKTATFIDQPVGGGVHGPFGIDTP
ncbi:MAG TPA: hypothetical protein VN224_10775 [Xanthomonadales bacterium]|nr:hypothetical protein [Xanthomonadales bacterium]